jgi:hypothetical protein
MLRLRSAGCNAGYVKMARVANSLTYSTLAAGFVAGSCALSAFLKICGGNKTATKPTPCGIR